MTKLIPPNKMDNFFEFLGVGEYLKQKVVCIKVKKTNEIVYLLNNLAEKFLTKLRKEEKSITTELLIISQELKFAIEDRYYS